MYTKKQHLLLWLIYLFILLCEYSLFSFIWFDIDVIHWFLSGYGQRFLLLVVLLVTYLILYALLRPSKILGDKEWCATNMPVVYEKYKDCDWISVVEEADGTINISAGMNSDDYYE